MSSSNPNQVTARLHSLRGEAYRHQRNLQNIRLGSLSSSTRRAPSLPYTYTSETDDLNVFLPYNAKVNVASVSSPPKTAGPPPPKSWVSSGTAGQQALGYKSSSEWRGHALELIFNHSPTTTSPVSSTPIPTYSRIPSLLHLTLHVLLHHDGIPLPLLHLLPRHILREYARYSAVHFPLPKETMEALWEIGCDGEVIILGPNKASFASIALEKMNALPTRSSVVNTKTNTVPTDWDASSLDDTDANADADLEDDSLDVIPTFPHTFIALSVTITPAHLSRLPTTLTHLALINVPRLPIHRLPAQVPFIEVLDLSFNIWVSEGVIRYTEMTTTSDTVELPPLLHRIEWRKWCKLRVLGLRDCGLETLCTSDVDQDRQDRDLVELRKKVNKGRLGDVQIVLGEIPR